MEIEILGEKRFYFFTEADIVWIKRPKWSVVGCGERLSEAISDLIENALIIKDAYCSFDDSELSKEAINLKHWLMYIKKEKVMPYES